MRLKRFEILGGVKDFSEPVAITLLRHPEIKRYAYILHDKDEGASPHYHVWIELEDPTDDKTVSRWFGKRVSVAVVKSNLATSLLYFLHANCDLQKHHYAPSEVKANFDFMKVIDKAKSGNPFLL